MKLDEIKISVLGDYQCDLQCQSHSVTEQPTVNLPKRLAGINIFFQFSWVKNGHFLTFNLIKISK